MKSEILTAILGNLTMVNYIVGFFFVFLALILRWIWRTLDGIKNNPESPHKFDFWYWWEDNFKPKLLSFIANMISVYLIFRFADDFIGTTFSYVLALGVGLGLDYYVGVLKKKLNPVPKNPEEKP